MKQNVITDALSWFRKFVRMPSKPSPDSNSLSTNPPIKGDIKDFEDALKKSGIELSVLNRHFLNRGNAVNVYCNEEEKNVWLALPVKADENAAKRIGLLGPQYDYNIQAVLKQLPLESYVTDYLKLLERRMMEGAWVNVDLLHNGKPLLLQVAADPLNRSIKMRDSLENKVTLADIGISLKAPERVEAYTIFQDGKKVGQTNDYIRTADILKRETDWYALNRIDVNIKVFGVTERSGLGIFKEKDMSEAGGKLVMQAGVKCTENGIYVDMNQLIKPADILTPEEKEFRQSLVKSPNMSLQEYVNQSSVYMHYIANKVVQQPTQKHSRSHKQNL